jgi:hypothetical protein
MRRLGALLPRNLGDPFLENVNSGMLGGVLPNGDDYRPRKAEEMTRRPSAEHIRKADPRILNPITQRRRDHVDKRGRH